MLPGNDCYSKNVQVRMCLNYIELNELRKKSTPGWKIDKLPSVCPNTSLPFLVGCHLNRQISDRKECASLCTVTPGSGPP